MRASNPGPIAASASLIALLGLAAAPREDGASGARARRMRELATAITLVPAAVGTKADLVPEPLYRFDDPARDFADGSLWAFGTSGRPAALLALALEKDDRGRPRWVHELTSLAGGLIAASSRHGSGPWLWNPKGPGLAFRPIPGAPGPADDEGGRLRQMGDEARRFRASESLDPARDDPSDRFELRLLPRPLLRYRDPGAGAVDGSIFLLAYGRNPEIALVIEARRGAGDAPSWHYALARISAARLRVAIDGNEVADLPKPAVAGWTSTYFLFDRPAPGLE